MNPFKGHTPHTILVVVTRRIGDVLLTTPLIRSLKNAWPNAHIDALVFSRTEGVLAANPDVRAVLNIAPKPVLREHLCLLKKIWRAYDLAISVVPSDRPTLYAWAAGKHSIGLVAAGNNQAWKRGLLSQHLPFDNLNTHTVTTNLQPAALLGIPLSPQVMVAWRTEDARAAQALLPFAADQTAYVVLHPYPMYAYKTWHRAGWIALAQWLQARGLQVVLTGGPGGDERAYVNDLVRDLARVLPQSVVNLAGKIGLAGSAFIIGHAQLYVGPDTATTHIAAALGVPTLALFGPSNPVKWGPWPKAVDALPQPYVMRGSQTRGNVTLLQGDDPRHCVPCLGEGCDKHVNSLSACLQQLSAEQVIAAAEKMLATSSVAHEF